MSVAVRQERAGDAQAVAEVHRRAFPTSAEADLVARLRADGDLVLSLVALDDGAAIGHAAFSRLWIEDGAQARPAIALAPVAVLPGRQGKGHGGNLVREGLDRLTAQGETLVFVLGDPRYYARFGFSAEAAAAFDSEYAGRYFQACRLGPAMRPGRVRYPAAFAALA